MPDFGPNVLVIDPSMPGGEIQARIDAIFAQQEAAHFTDRRFAILFKPGRYTTDVRVGFFTQVLGLGTMPGAVTIDGHVRVNADWLKGDALANFWRGAENLTVRPPEGWDRWAVSQAAPYRRMHVLGDLVLDDGGSSSGGFLADCRIEGTIRAGSQQQWYSRSSRIGGWQGVNWNMMFQGVQGAPATSFPDPAVTTLLRVPLLREKPFLQVDAAGSWSVFVPALRRDAEGTSWADGPTAGSALPLAHFFLARPGMDAATLNAALARGQHLLFTPGVYRLDAPLRVTAANRVLLGIWLATLQAVQGNAVLEIDDVPGVTIAGLMIDAGAVRSLVLVQVGPRGCTGDHRHNPVLLADLFFRVDGGTGSQGNPGLLPYKSKNLDFSAEWYYRPDSYISVGYFHKSVVNFIGTGQVKKPVFGLTNPADGPRYKAALEALGAGATSNDIRQYIFANYPGSVKITGGTPGNYTGDILGLPEDAPVLFTVNTPVNNNQTANVHGWEFAVQHSFWETGLGMILNYTIVDGDVHYRNDQPATVNQFALVGLSDTANVIGYYDKNGIQARVAYNWRAEFLSGAGSNPSYTEPYGQIDASASWEALPRTTLFFEGINLTGEGRRAHQRTDRYVTVTAPGYARYTVGVRYRF
ncbi:TonB-dependent receptor [Sphingomonas sp. NFR04]|uniref:TonB-dependent receptor domain-containing protein n=1 Tax=Sphingomonas sp. NFR04 TaxID=1566283 RepID=UPI0020C8B486|nr:TonB-dependent receptor [Sphingomonas sp. NFR04]